MNLILRLAVDIVFLLVLTFTTLPVLRLKAQVR